MARTYHPDRWVIVRMEHEDEGVVYKVLGGWSGGYLDGDSWRFSSGLESIEEDGDYYLMHNYSGSIYKCHKNSNGFNFISGGVYSRIEKEGKEVNCKVSNITVKEFLDEQNSQSGSTESN